MISKTYFEEKITQAATSLPQPEAIRLIKKTFKSLSRKVLLELLQGKVLLNSDKVERGTIFVKQLWTIGKYSFSILELTQDSKIAWHRHETEIEYYIIWRRNDPAPCLIGEGHEIENTSNIVKYVLSVKIKQ
ncbi:MAG: hypothetical protein Q4D02_02030 [Clostridia bacterium]|nr:hypothetical protein [Clostridia bacterium]